MSADPDQTRPGYSTHLEMLADEGGPGYSVYLSHLDHVRLMAPVRTWLAASRREDRSPILVTGPAAVLSPLTVDAMRISGACWAVRTDAGVYDGLSGRRIHAFTDFRSPRDSERHPVYSQVPQPTDAAIMIEVIAGRRADAQTLIGPLAEATITALGGAAPDRWGLEEPLTRSADHQRFTDSIRAQMPIAEPHLLVSPDGSFASVSVARTQHGLTERVRAGIPVGTLGGTPHEELVRGVGEVFVELQEQIPLVAAFASLAPVVDLALGRAQRPGLRAAEEPLAVLIGPRATRDLQIDVEALQHRFDLTAAGRARTPSVLLRLPQERSWQTYSAFIDALDPHRLASALGIDDDFIVRIRSQMGLDVPETPAEG